MRHDRSGGAFFQSRRGLKWLPVSRLLSQKVETCGEGVVDRRSLLPAATIASAFAMQPLPRCRWKPPSPGWTRWQARDSLRLARLFILRSPSTSNLSFVWSSRRRFGALSWYRESKRSFSGRLGSATLASLLLISRLGLEKWMHRH